jgi:hypothetical protein
VLLKLKYYSREILKYLLLAEAVYVAASNPHFALKIAKNISKLRKGLAKERLRRSFNYFG